MTSPSNTWSTDKPHNLRPTLARKNSVDSSKLKSPLTAGSIIKPVKITPGSETRAASASPIRNKKTTTATETQKTKEKKTKELELESSSAATTGTVGKEIKLSDCRVLLKDITKDESQTKKKPESTDRIVIITDPKVAETGETQDTTSDLARVTKVETKHSSEIKDEEEEEAEKQEIKDTRATEIKKKGEADKGETKNNKQEEVGTEEEEGETDEEEEEEDEETRARNLEELFDGPFPTVLKDGQSLLPPPIYRVISTPEKGLIGINFRVPASKPPVVKEREKTTISSEEIVKEKRKGTKSRQEEEEDMADRGLIPQNFTGTEDAEHWWETVQLWLTFRELTEEKALAAVKLLLKGGAWQWYIGLDERKKSHLRVFEKAFKERYMTASINKWRDQTQVMNLSQGLQSVDDYITDAQNKRRKTEMSDELFQAIIIKGLRPHIRQQVMQHEPQNVEDIRKWGVVAETSEDSKDNTSDMATVMKALIELKADQKEMKAEAAKARSSHNVHAMGSPGSPRPMTPTSTPKVQFQEAVQTGYYTPNQPIAYQQDSYGQAASGWQSQQMPQTNNYHYGYYDTPAYSNYYGNQGIQSSSGGWRGRGRGAQSPSTRYGNQPQTRFNVPNANSSRGGRFYNNTERGGYRQRGMNEQSQTASACWNCGSTTRHGRDNCPAKDKRCLQCSKIGHFKVVCRSGQRQY